ncbi:hypothetical protein D3C83_245960 [compost metagenome]
MREVIGDLLHELVGVRLDVFFEPAFEVIRYVGALHVVESLAAHVADADAALLGEAVGDLH